MMTSLESVQAVAKGNRALQSLMHRIEFFVSVTGMLSMKDNASNNFCPSFGCKSEGKAKTNNFLTSAVEKMKTVKFVDMNALLSESMRNE